MKTENFLNAKTMKHHGIHISRVQNNDYLDSLKDIYKCNICFKIMINPSDCDKCGHSYCFDCISDSQCPFNCENYSIRPSSIGIKLILNNLFFKCENEGCSESIQYNSVISHDSQCEFRVIKCPNLNCGISLTRKNLQNHIEKECKYTIEKCRFCNFNFPRIEIKSHYDSCETIFHSLNLSVNDELNLGIINNQDSDSVNNNSNIHNSSNLTAKKDFSKIKTKSYLEALSLNLSKIVKENDQKYKALQEENNIIKNEFNSEVKDLLVKMNEKLEKINNEDLNATKKDLKNGFFIEHENDDENELLNNIIDEENKIKKEDIYNDKQLEENFSLTQENFKKQEINFDLSANDNHLKTTDLDNNLRQESGFNSYDKSSNKHNVNLIKNSEKIPDLNKKNLFKQYLREILEKNIKDNFVSGVNNNFKLHIDQLEEKLKEIFISESLKENVKFNEEIVKIIRQIVKSSEDNIKSFLKDIKSYIIEEFKDHIKTHSPSKEILEKLDLNSNKIHESLTKFALDFSEIKEIIEDFSSKEKCTNNLNDLDTNSDEKAQRLNVFSNNIKENKILEESIENLKSKTEEIEFYIKKIYEEYIKEFINLNSNNIKQQQENIEIIKNLENFKKLVIDEIKEKIELKNESITNYIEVSIVHLKNIIQNNFKETSEKIENLNLKIDGNYSLENKINYNSNNNEENERYNTIVERITSDFLKNVIETFDKKIKEVKNLINDKLEKQTNDISLKVTNDSYSKNKDIDYKLNNDIYLDEKDRNSINYNRNFTDKNGLDFKLTSIIQKFESNFNEEFETLKNDINIFNKNNKEIKTIITEEFGEITEVLKDLKNSNKLSNDKDFIKNLSNSDNEIENKNKNKKLFDDKFLEEILENKVNLIYDKITKNLKENLDVQNQNIRSFIKDEVKNNKNAIIENIEKNQEEINSIQENIKNLNKQFEKIEALSEKIDNVQEGIQDEINNFSQNNKKSLEFNQMDLLIKLKENFDELKTNNDNINENIYKSPQKKKNSDDKLNNLGIFSNKSNKANLINFSPTKILTEEMILKNNENLKSEIMSSIELKLKSEFDSLDNKIDLKLTQKFKSFYELKWCNQCERIDYNFAFTLCKICNKDNCKECIKLCKKCKTLDCKKCVLCPKCSDFSCINCRSDCFFCSKEKEEKFCSDCLKNCFFCKKATCMECTRQCLNCSSLTCGECARLCRICLKCSCRRCETIKNFKNCFHCKQTSCNECVVECTECKLEVCNNCFNSCKNCSKLLCKKCGIDCENCGDIFCDKCAKERNQNNCFICRKVFCVACVKYLRKCKKCGGNSCKNCCANCLKCKNVFCKNCNVNCDSCEDYACVLCVYRCACEKLIFCEKCLFGITPVSPDMHSCVLFLNESPVFTGIKSRSKISLPKNFEAKFFLEKFDSMNFLIGITDNSTFNEDTLSFIDNIWTFKPKTGQKYSTKKSLENYYNKEAREKDFIIIAIKNDNLYFRVNFDDNPPAYQLPQHRDYFLYIENDSFMSNLRVKFIYLRKI